MQTFTKITKLKFKDKRGRIETYRVVQMDVNDEISYAIYYERNNHLYLQFKTKDIEQLNSQYQGLLVQAREDGKRYQVCRIM